jgi:Flp pilus assembly pilin Flp
LTAIDWLVAALRALSSDAEHGATSLEYALVASLIAAVIAGVVATFGTEVVALYATMIGVF